MIRTTLFLKTTPENAQAVLSVYEQYDILQYSLDHSEATASELSIATDDGGYILVTALWPSTEAYQGWIDNPERDRTGVILNELLSDAVGVGRTFEIQQSVSK